MDPLRKSALPTQQRPLQRPHKPFKVNGLAVHGWLALCLGLAAQTALAQLAYREVSVPSLEQVQGQALQQRGFWFALPAAATGDRPRAAVVLLHGCGGPYGRGGQLTVRMRDYAALLNGWGLQVLVTDSLSPRGEQELCTQALGSRRVTQVHRRQDALGALQWLAAQPGVDPRRLGLIGWSHGGSAVLTSLDLSQPMVRDAPVKPAFAVAFYPGCADSLRRGWLTSAPLLLLVGAADDWTTAAPCEALALSAGPAVNLQTFPDAHHGFDSLVPVRLRPDVPNGVHPGRGVHVGGQPAARDAALVSLQQFLREQAATD